MVGGTDARGRQEVPGQYTVGGMFTHIWSFAGDDDRDDVSMTTIQPAATFFLNKKGTSITFGSETTYNWEADEDHWQVPLSVGLTKSFPRLASRSSEWVWPEATTSRNPSMHRNGMSVCHCRLFPVSQRQVKTILPKVE